MAEDHGAGLLLQLQVEEFQQPPGGLLAAQAAELVQRLPLQVEELGKLLLAAVGVLDLLRQLALRALDDLLLLAKLLGLFLQGVLALVQEAFALVELAAEAAELLFAFALGLDRLFLDFQLGLAAAVLHLLLGPADDLLGFQFGVAAAEMVQQRLQQEGQSGRQHRGNNHHGGGNGCHGFPLGIESTTRLRRLPPADASVPRHRARIPKKLDAGGSAAAPPDRLSAGRARGLREVATDRRDRVPSRQEKIQRHRPARQRPLIASPTRPRGPIRPEAVENPDQDEQPLHHRADARKLVGSCCKKTVRILAVRCPWPTLRGIPKAFVNRSFLTCVSSVKTPTTQSYQSPGKLQRGYRRPRNGRVDGSRGHGT